MCTHGLDSTKLLMRGQCAWFFCGRTGFQSLDLLVYARKLITDDPTKRLESLDMPRPHRTAYLFTEEHKACIARHVPAVAFATLRFPTVLPVTVGPPAAPAAPAAVPAAPHRPARHVPPPKEPRVESVAPPIRVELPTFATLTDQGGKALPAASDCFLMGPEGDVYTAAHWIAASYKLPSGRQVDRNALMTITEQNFDKLLPMIMKRRRRQ
jgi:hypothetical protein